MRYVKSVGTQILEVKKSKFIAFVTPYIEYKETLEILKKQHPKARHFVVAYRYLNEFNQIVEYSSDDGEPKGTSGKPTLMVLQGANLINSAAIVVRYFGGTKLGTGGLVRAYSDAVNLALNEALLLKYKEEITKKISFMYENSGKIEYECSIHNINIIDQIFTSNVTYEIKGSVEDMKMLLQKIDRLITN